MPSYASWGLEVAELRLRSNISFKSCGIAIAELFPSSCGNAVADSKKSCACPPLLVYESKSSLMTYLLRGKTENYGHHCWHLVHVVLYSLSSHLSASHLQAGHLYCRGKTTARLLDVFDRAGNGEVDGPRYLLWLIPRLIPTNLKLH
jgi:hypothetical protein